MRFALLHAWRCRVGVRNFDQDRIAADRQSQFAAVVGVLGDVLDKFGRHEQDILRMI